MTATEKVSFSKYGKSFQEKLAFIVLDDRVFADRMMEVLNIEFLEYRYLQAFVEKIFQYKKKYSSHPSNETMKTIIRSGIDDLNEVTQKQIRDYYAKAMADISILESCEFVKDTAIDFCRKQKLREAMLKSTTLLQKCSFDEISVVINNALKAGADADFGYDYIKDFEERFEFTGRETITTGWKKMDEITGGGGGRGEIGVVIAPTGVGKSMVLVHLGAEAVKAGMTVVHYTLELKDTVIASRYDSCITGIPLNELMDRKEENREYLRDIDGTLIVKEYPTKTATTNTIRAHIEKLKQQGITPDMIIVDYADLLRTLSSRKEKREELESIYEELRAIMQENNCVGWTASQTNRTGLNQEIITMEAISEAFNKCFVADFICSLSRTVQDKQANKGRMFIAKNRNGPDGLIFPAFVDWSNVNMKVLNRESGESIADVIKDSSTNTLDFLREKYKKHK